MIIPAILTTNERAAIERIKLASRMSNWIHIDLLDNSLYNYQSLSLEELNQLTFHDLNIELHGMISNPQKILSSGISFDRLIIHYETPKFTEYYQALLVAGPDIWVALDPSTSLNQFTLPDAVGGIVVMGVTPGQSGQAMLPGTFERIETLKNYFPDTPITVDGGVNENNIRQLLACGADNFVMASGLFGTPDPVETYNRCLTLADPLQGRKISVFDDKNEDL